MRGRSSLSLFSIAAVGLALAACSPATPVHDRSPLGAPSAIVDAGTPRGGADCGVPETSTDALTACADDEIACKHGCARATLDPENAGRRAVAIADACDRLGGVRKNECTSSADCGGATCCVASTMRDMVDSTPHAMNVCTRSPKRDCSHMIESDGAPPVAVRCGKRRCRPPRPLCYQSPSGGPQAPPAECKAEDEPMAGGVYSCGSASDCPPNQICIISGNGFGGSYCALNPTSGGHRVTCAKDADCLAARPPAGSIYEMFYLQRARCVKAGIPVTGSKACVEP